MFEITVTKGLEFIITLNNHNFLFIHIPHGGNYPSLQIFHLYLWAVKRIVAKKRSDLQGVCFLSFSTKHKENPIKFVFGIWHYFNR